MSTPANWHIFCCIQLHHTRRNAPDHDFEADLPEPATIFVAALAKASEEIFIRLALWVAFSANTRRCSMRSIDKFIWMSLFFSAFFFYLAQSWAAENVAGRTDYAAAIDIIIVKCEKKQPLENSRSRHLRSCADKAAAKAHFLRSRQTNLIEKMVDSQIPLKPYRIEQFVNAQYAQSVLSAR
jgi:hypothetical protein